MGTYVTIMKNITRTASYTILGIVIFIIALGIIFVSPAQAQADYYDDRGYYGTPSYNYGYSYNRYEQTPNYGALRASCYPMPLSARTGDSVTWAATAYGGNGSYNYTWSGTDGLSGYGSSVVKYYYSSGTKSASVTVTSGGQSITKICDGAATIYGDTYYRHDYDYNYNYNYQYSYPYYNYPYTYYSPLYVTCRPHTTYANTGATITWTAYPSGGTGSYTYTWSGTDGLYGSSQSLFYSYQNPGLKTANVTVYSSSGQTTTISCGTINIGGYYQGTTNQNTNSGLDVACYADPSTVRVNQPVTWRAEATGGAAPYTYTWTGSDGLSGSENTVLKYYGTTGDKSAIITIKSADGRTATRACSTSVTVRPASTTVTPAERPTPVTPQVQPDTNNDRNESQGLSAAALFSLKNVPWGWVAILIILVLFATVVYLIFNRPKI